MSTDRRYTQQEVDAILKRALERDRTTRTAGSDAITHTDLIDTAREVGIEPAQVEAAIVEVKREEQALATREAWLASRKQAITRMAGSWALVSAICFVICMVNPATWWMWVAGPWGLVILLQYLKLQRGPTERELRQAERRLERERRKQQLEERFERGAQVLETVVAEGANLLLSHLDERARRLEASRRNEAQADPGRLGPKR